MRFVPLDRLRALAVVSMVQGHTFSALLAEGALPPPLMRIHALVHGLTAPAFLFGAGLAFGLATYPRYGARRGDRATLWRRLRRYAGLLMLGYALQLPGGSLFAALRLEGAALLPVLQVGPLHLIALCLGLSELATRVIGSARRHAQLAAALAVVVALATPAFWKLPLHGAPELALGPWLAGRTGSLFPLFPWASFALFGQACGYLVGGADTRQLAPPAAGRSAAYFCGAGVALAGSSYALFASGIRLSEPGLFWHTSPLYLSFRLGLVLLLLGALHIRARDELPRAQVARGDGPERSSVSALFARHSLTAYVAHLLVLYGTPLTPSLHRHIGGTLSAPQATLVFVLLLGFTLLAIRTLAWLREQREYGWLRVGLTALLIATLAR